MEVPYTPRHGSWLNMAGIKFPVLWRHCLSERMDDKACVTEQVAAWEDGRNAHGTRIAWRSTTEAARIKLKRLDPKIHRKGVLGETTT